MKDMLTITDVADFLKVKRRYARDILSKRPDFPPPAVNLTQKYRLWAMRDIENWLAVRSK